MDLRRPVFALGILSVAVLLVTVSCGVGGGGGPVPPLPSDFFVGATIPGWILSPSSTGRDEVLAASSHDGQRWSVILSRPLERRPRDAYFALAIGDNASYHSGLSMMKLTFDPQASSTADTVAAERVANGQVVPDGQLGPGEWNVAGLQLLSATPQNVVPPGLFPAPQNVDLLATAAWDDEYVYLLFQWIDTSSTQSDVGPQLQWDGAQWVRRPHAANDTNGNGILEPGEPMTVASSTESEDSLMLMWPIQDGANSFLVGGQGCAASCHVNPSLSSSGAEAVHALVCEDDLWDVWSWGAARTAPSLRMDDRILDVADASLGLSGGGSGFADDAGQTPSIAQGFTVPDLMFASPPAGQQALVSQMIEFATTTPPGFPVPGPVNANAVAYAAATFNGTALPPATWTGMPPFQNDYLPAWIMRPATGSAADVEAAASFGFGLWTLEIRRKRVTRDGTGAPRADDVQFEDDADFLAAFQQTVAAQGLPFSISITDGASGHGVRETRYEGPLRASGDASLGGAPLPGDLYVHDYGPGFMPSSAASFADPRFTAPVPDAGPDVGLELKAGTDGVTLFVLASWNDPTPDSDRDTWTWNGFTWEQGGGQDELRMLFNAGMDDQAFVQGGGCAYLCHGPGGGIGAPAASSWFGTTVRNAFADLWHWQAGRTDPRGVADDATVGWRFDGNVVGGAPGAAVRGDAGPSPYTINFDPGLPHPLWMAPGDPNASAPFLSTGVPGQQNAVPFTDVLGGLPAGSGGGGGGVSFQGDVLPLLQANCTTCHPPFGGLDLTSYAGVLAGGQSGPVVTPGDPAGSLIIQRLNGTITPQMPLGGTPLPATQIQTIADWISEGALDN